ncbi:NHS-like protein 1 isoform X2 [Genypterus blacodes]|uniref:NHS-like protein 1 isoform X2 n=1 Tax=Genypterus blacodes TaxID=154954 RepID=UPI003F770943
MPFHQRTVEPRHVSRLSPRDGWRPGEEAGRRKLRKPVLFSSLDEVGCHTLTNMIHQLSDLSRYASDIFLGIEMEAGMAFRRSCRIQGRLQSLQDQVRKLEAKKVKIPVSNLDEESKWTVHYTAPWHQQENVFLPGSRPPCVEDLHRQAKVNLKTALRECDKLRKDGFRSSQYYSQGPTFSDPLQSTSSLQEDEDEDIDKKSTASSVEDDKSQLAMRPQTPQGRRGEGEGLEIDGQVVRNKAAPLPTPEEKMRQVAKAVPTDIVPINVTGAVFDRQASFRRSLINTDTVSRRPKKVKRRKTISGLPDNFHDELAKGRGGELRPHSMYIPGQYSTLGRVGSVNSTLRRSVTRDTSCQTEEVKVVPPSMRRIRAQRGQGIAAQMAGISASSSTGCMSISSGDISGLLVLPPHLNGNASRFHSLPRQGARVSLSSDPVYSSTPIKPEGQTSTHRQIGKLQVDNTVVHLRSAPRLGTLPRPKSQEVRGTQVCEWGGGPACVVSPHAAYSMSFIPNATLSNSSELVALPPSAQKHPHSPAPTHPAARPLSVASSTGADSLNSASFTHSSAALATSTPTHRPQGAAPAPPSESGCSDSSLHSRSTLAATPPSCQAEEQWIYDTPEHVGAPHRPLTSSCSTPINQMYSSLDLSSRTTTDSSSLYSQDNDGYFTSMHLDSGLRSRSQGSGPGLGGAGGRPSRHSMYECRELSNQEDSVSLYSDRSLSRSISLRKSKKPPLPPARTDSLRRKPGAKKPIGGVSAVGGANEANGGTLNESLIATLQQSLQLGLRGGKGKGASPSSPSHSPSSDYDDPWVLRPRSQSSVSATSSAPSLVANAKGGGASNMYSLCHVTPAHSDTSSLRSDYADSWGYYMDYPSNHGDQRAQTPSTHSTDTVSTGPHPGEQQNGAETRILGKSQTPAAPGREGETVAKPKMAASSPDRVHRLTSPSSGYSSQSNTPTAGTPVPSLVRSMSPAGTRPKPKVPERKSSLLSSVSMSSSSTSLSSTTSDSLKSYGAPPPLPPPLPPLQPLFQSCSSAPGTPLSAPPPFPAPLPPYFGAISSAPPPLPSTPQRAPAGPSPPCSTSPEFPPPPSPEMLVHPSSSFNGSCSPPPPPPVPCLGPPPPPPLVPCLAPPPPPVPCLGPPPPPPLPPPSSSLFSVKPTRISSKPAGSPVSSGPSPSPKPLITAFALQSVQLRSVKRPEKETNGTSDRAKAQEAGANLIVGLKPHTLVRQHSLDHPTLLPLLSCSLEEDSRTSSPSPVSKLLEDILDCGVSDGPPESAVPNGEAEGLSYFLLNGKATGGENREEGEALQRPSQSSRSSPLKQKPPAVSKKPKLPVGSPFTSQPIRAQGSSQQHGDVGSSREEDRVDAPPRQVDETREETRDETRDETEQEVDGPSASPEPPAERRSETPTETSRVFSHTRQETSPDEGQRVNGDTQETQEEEEDDGTSSTSGSISSREDENSEVFSSAPGSPAATPANGARRADMVTPSPTRPRTTEDLFAAIHRSKRKVLGRKESEEDKCRPGSQSPPATPVTPVTPTAPAPAPAPALTPTPSPAPVSSLTSPLPRQSGSIQRNLRKSATSSDSFKALLLKKGSHSGTGFRMSATEMLRSTDPRFQRTRSESALDSPTSPSSPTAPHSPCASPGRGKRAADDWNRYESLALSSPTSPSYSLSGMKYGRSRTPPSAASSKYNARCRIMSSPMTVICEREGELAESEHGDATRPLTQSPLVLTDSNGTLSEESMS